MFGKRPQYAWVIPVGNKVTYCITVPVVSRVSHFVLYGVRSWYLSKIKSPVSFNKECLVKGLNMPGSFPWGIRSRIALQSQLSLECPTLSYMVCGVGICPKLSNYQFTKFDTTHSICSCVCVCICIACLN